MTWDIRRSVSAGRLFAFPAEMAERGWSNLVGKMLSCGTSTTCTDDIGAMGGLAGAGEEGRMGYASVNEIT